MQEDLFSHMRQSLSFLSLSLSLSSQLQNLLHTPNQLSKKARKFLEKDQKLRYRRNRREVCAYTVSRTTTKGFSLSVSSSFGCSVFGQETPATI